MEALVILLAHFLPILWVMALTLAVLLTIFLFSSMVQGIITFSVGLKAIALVKEEPVEIKGFLYSTARHFKNISLMLTIFILFALIMINFVYYEPVMRFITHHIAEKTHINVNYTHAKGNLFTGEFYFNDLVVKRDNVEKQRFKFMSKYVGFKVSLWHLLHKPMVIDILEADHITGNIKNFVPLTVIGRKQLSDHLHFSRDFIIKEVKLSHVVINSENSNENPLYFNFKKFHIEKMRSHYGFFDAFFRANIEGTVNGHPISIINRPLGHSMRSQWQLPLLPVEILSHFIATPPFTWLKTGTIALECHLDWPFQKKGFLTLHWDLLLKEVHSHFPENLTGLKRSIAIPLAQSLEKQKGNLHLHFTTRLKDRSVKDVTSLHAFWEKVAQDFTRAIL